MSIGIEPCLKHAVREALLQHLHDGRWVSTVGLADEQMNMLRHQHIADHHKTVATAYLLQDFEKHIAAARRAQQRSTLITTGGDVVEISAAVVTMETSGHGR